MGMSIIYKSVTIRRLKFTSLKFLVDNQVMVIDFDNNVNYAQGLMYRKMLECRKTTESKKPDSDTSSHSPIRNTAEIKKLE